MPTRSAVQEIVPYDVYNGVTFVSALGYHDAAADHEIEPAGMTAGGLYIISNEDVFVAGTVTLDIELIDTGWGDAAKAKTAISTILAASPTTVHTAAGYHVVCFSAEAALTGVDILIDHPLPPALKLSWVFDANDHTFAAAAYFVEAGRAAV